jgi:hypothetical protein
MKFLSVLITSYAGGLLAIKRPRECFIIRTESFNFDEKFDFLGVEQSLIQEALICSWRERLVFDVDLRCHSQIWQLAG